MPTARRPRGKTYWGLGDKVAMSEVTFILAAWDIIPLLERQKLLEPVLSRVVERQRHLIREMVAVAVGRYTGMVVRKLQPIQQANILAHGVRDLVYSTALGWFDFSSGTVVPRVKPNDAVRDLKSFLTGHSSLVDKLSSEAGTDEADLYRQP